MGQPVFWFDKYLFRVEIDNVVSAAFTACTGLSVEAANVQHFEGGRLHAHNSPGRVTYGPITLTRGATVNLDLYNWFKETYDAASGTGSDIPDIYKSFDIIQLNRKKVEIAKFSIVNAYSTTFQPGDRDNTVDEKVIETVIVQPDYWEMALI